MTFTKSLLAALFLLRLAAPSWGAERVGDALVLRVPALPEAARHLKLLETPSFLALALENNGISPSYSSRLAIKSRVEFGIRSATLRFAGRKGMVFRYEASIQLPLGGSSAVFSVPVEVDCSSLESGALVVRVYPPLSSLLPAEVLERIEFKVRALANESAQRQIVRYLDDLAARLKAPSGSDAMLEAVLVEAYNRGAPAAATGRDTGDAVPIAEQYALIATLAIWLVIVPLFLFVRSRARARHATKAAPKA